jgi:hypothetical protein
VAGLAWTAEDHIRRGGFFYGGITAPSRPGALFWGAGGAPEWTWGVFCLIQYAVLELEEVHLSFDCSLLCRQDYDCCLLCTGELFGVTRTERDEVGDAAGLVANLTVPTAF